MNNLFHGRFAGANHKTDTLDMLRVQQCVADHINGCAVHDDAVKLGGCFSHQLLEAELRYKLLRSCTSLVSEDC